MVVIQLWQNSRWGCALCSQGLRTALSSDLDPVRHRQDELTHRWFYLSLSLAHSLSSFSSHRLAFCFHQSPSSCPCTLLLFISIFQSLSHHLRLTIIIYSLLNMIQVTDDLLQCNNSPPLQKETGFRETSLAADRADISIGSGIEWEEKWHHYTWVCIGVWVMKAHEPWPHYMSNAWVHTHLP